MPPAAYCRLRCFMSAIFGILRFDGAAVNLRDMERMGNVLAHRGPDGRKFIADGAVGLGHCLMRVNNEDLFEAQPLVDREAELTLVADCRIDNREELAGIFGLSTADSRDMPDSALILRAYKAWGEDCTEHLLGDFAFAVWDGSAKKLVLVRDHMGQRNLFYHKGANFIAFASEIKGLWALADVPRKLLDEEIARFFFKTIGQRPEGRTLYADICAVPGGTIVTTGLDGIVKSRHYWEPYGDPAHEGRDESYYVEKYRSILAEAVTCRLRRLTGPAALMNSAGFDTTAIAGLAGPVVAAQGRKLISLSWIGSQASLNMHGDLRPWLDACRRVMSHLDIREISRAGENPLANVERQFLHKDGPGYADYKISHYLFTEAASAGSRLIMDGFGGDYTINPRGFGALARHLRRGRLVRFFMEFRAHLRETGQSPWQTLKSEIIIIMLPQFLVRWQRHVRRKGAYALMQVTRRDIAGLYLKKLRKRIVAEARTGAESIPLTEMRARIRHVAVNICRGSAAGSPVPAGAYGLDLTRPFHDKRVVELGLAIPEDLYVKNGLNRYITRLALADIYPPEFQTRGHKNEGILSDNIAVLDATTPELLAETDRLSQSAKLSAYFDFKRARDLLQCRAPNGHAEILAKKTAAVEALLTARFINWFGSSNAS
jgi:asparagine synthase (glutamine-hydrolysing)